MSRINGVFYSHDVKRALQYFGPMNIQQIKAKLAMIDVKVDDTQVLEAVERLVKQKAARKGSQDLWVATL